MSTHTKSFCLLRGTLGSVGMAGAVCLSELSCLLSSSDELCRTQATKCKKYQGASHSQHREVQPKLISETHRYILVPRTAMCKHPMDKEPPQPKTRQIAVICSINKVLLWATTATTALRPARSCHNSSQHNYSNNCRTFQCCFVHLLVPA